MRLKISPKAAVDIIDALVKEGTEMKIRLAKAFDLPEEKITETQENAELEYYYGHVRQKAEGIQGTSG